MKNILKLVIISALLIVPLSQVKAEAIANRLKGKILLQVESHGEAYYVHPTSTKAYYMANGDEAYNIMRELGVGITNKDLERIKTDKIFAKKLSGKIFLQVQSRGEAFYINSDGTPYYLKDGAAAYETMRSLGLGITNRDLEKMSVENKVSGLTNLSGLTSQDKSASVIKAEKSQMNNNLECNGKNWSPCQNEKKFYCPPSGEPTCSPSDIEILTSESYKKDLINVVNKYIEKLGSFKQYTDSLDNLYKNRIGYLQGLSVSNTSLMETSDVKYYKLIYLLGNYYNSAITDLKSDNESLVKIQDILNSSILQMKNNLENIKNAKFFDKNSYETVMNAYVDADEKMSNHILSFKKLYLDKFNNDVAIEDSEFEKSWDLINKSSLYEDRKQEQIIIQNNYITQINQYNNYAQSYRPIRCYSSTTFGLTSIRCN